MSKRVSVLCAVLLVMMVVPAPFAGAKQSLDVEIEVTVVPGVFEASGPAVEAGLMCEGGTINPTLEKYAGPGSSAVVRNLQVITEFTCVGGDLDGDTFVVKQQLHIDLTAAPPTWTFGWVLKGGTGVFADLHGNGDGTGILLSEFPFGPYDVLEGRLH